MLIEFAELPEDAALHADLCVIGAGAAGIAIATALIGTGLRVWLLESGGLAPEATVQALYEGETVGIPWGTGLATCRSRYFGGTTNQWPGGCVPLDALDLQERPWVAYSGWPISRDELDPWYEQARTLLRTRKAPIGAGDEKPPFVFDPARLVHCRVVGSQARRMGVEYRTALASADNVRVLLHANLVALQANPSASLVQEAEIQSLDGRRARVRARRFVLACGGIENARLLLLSDSVVPQGLGNQHDLVGRFFMDHPSGKLGSIVSDVGDRLTAPYNRQVISRGVARPGEISLSAQVQREQCLLNARMRPQDYENDEAVPDGVKALRMLIAELRRGRWSCRTPALAWRSCADLPNLLPAICRRLRGRSVVHDHHIDLEGFFEQEPNPDSRVTLSDRRDALGLRRVRLDWRLTELDRRTYRATAAVFGAEMTRLGIGDLLLEPWLRSDTSDLPDVHGMAHHLGTTRMADDPTRGVVDRDCRVHGIENLCVAGGSVFPTGGWAPPTFTIVALALRLADHLRRLS